MISLGCSAQTVGLAVAAVLLGSCSFGGQISDHAVRYNKSVEQAHNSQLILNILRARDRRPMHFTAVSQVRGSFTLSTAGNVSIRIPFGGDAASDFPLTPSINISETSRPSFDVAVLDSKKFVSGILSPIKLSTFRFFWDQGWPDQLLLHLLVHKFTPVNESTSENGRYFQNTPHYDKGCEPARKNALPITGDPSGSFCLFRAWVDEVTRPGAEKLSFGTTKKAVAIGPPVNFSAAENLDALVKVAESEADLVIFDDQQNPGMQRLCKITASHTFCLGECPSKKRADLQKECTEPASANSGSIEQADDSDEPAVLGAGGKVIGRIELRSVQAALYYLGEVIRAGGVGVTVGRRAGNEAGTRVGLFEVTTDPTLASADELSVEYEDGERIYLVKGDDSENSKLVRNLSATAMALLNQLLALHKESDELPTTTAVEAVGQ